MPKFSEVIFDLETKKLFEDIEGSDPKDLGVSIVSAYSRILDENLTEIEGRMQSFWEADFEKMWPLFQGADRIIGFNSIKFDVPALANHAPFPFSKLTHFDILDKVRESVGRRISLDALAKDTLGTKKVDVGTNAVVYWRKGDKDSLARLKKYCEKDVEITRDLYDYVLKNGQLKYTDKWNTPQIIEVDFSYPTSDESSEQIGLF